MNQQLKAQEMAIDWIRKNDPKVYELAAKRHSLKQGSAAIYGLSGYEADEFVALNGIADFFTTLTDTVSKVLPQAIQYKTQSNILKAQLKRGEQGLPPLDVYDYSPVFRVEPDFSPESEAALTRMAIDTTGSALTKILPYAAMALGLVLILKRRS
jgi:hypothetical protein